MSSPSPARKNVNVGCRSPFSDLEARLTSISSLTLSFDHRANDASRTMAAGDGRASSLLRDASRRPATCLRRREMPSAVQEAIAVDVTGRGVLLERVKRLALVGPHLLAVVASEVCASAILRQIGAVGRHWRRGASGWSGFISISSKGKPRPAGAVCVFLASLGTLGRNSP